MKVHVEGMGLQGSLLAVQLERHGVDFTWHDIEAGKTAWKASTGAIYPAGSTKFGPDAACWNVWRHWHDKGVYGGHTEAANYAFGHKSTLPHQGRYTAFGPDRYGLRHAEPKSYHLNAQTLVPWARERYADRRTDGPLFAGKAPDWYVVSHGFGERLGYVYWGWTRLVELRYDHDEFYARDGDRPCFYFRPNKIVMAYAYPVPGTPYWYAGSSLIKQAPDKAKSLEIEPKYERWKVQFERLANGAAEVVGEADFIEGWRPAAGDDHWLKVNGSTVELRPLWNSGIRHFPQQWNILEGLLGLPNNDLVEQVLS